MALVPNVLWAQSAPPGMTGLEAVEKFQFVLHRAKVGGEGKLKNLEIKNFNQASA